MKQQQEEPRGNADDARPWLGRRCARRRGGSARDTTRGRSARHDHAEPSAFEANSTHSPEIRVYRTSWSSPTNSSPGVHAVDARNARWRPCQKRCSDPVRWRAAPLRAVTGQRAAAQSLSIFWSSLAKRRPGSFTLKIEPMIISSLLGLWGLDRTDKRGKTGQIWGLADRRQQAIMSTSQSPAGPP